MADSRFGSDKNPYVYLKVARSVTITNKCRRARLMKRHSKATVRNLVALQIR